MRALILLAGTVFLSLATGAYAASLNKCIDAQGAITYSNLPCRNAQETRAVEIDPAPPVPKTSPPPPAPKPVQAPAPTLHLDTRRTQTRPVAQASQRQCDVIADKLGKVLDKMDQARRKGYTQEQINAWNEEIRTFERKKQQAGCF